MFLRSNLENCKIGDQGCFNLCQIKAPKLSTLSLSKYQEKQTITTSKKKDAKIFQEEAGNNLMS